MNIVGIVAEYNPFHKGHAYQIRKTRELLGEDTAVVCVMSGDFVQRGEPAVFSKYARAEAAVRCGADLVIELPLHGCLGSAERFADSAVSILGRLGVVDYLVFGSELDDKEALERTAQVLLTSDFDDRLRYHLQTGCSFPSARSAALCDLMGGVDMTQTPNNNLGIEYIKAILRSGYTMKPFPILREGAMHDAVYDGDMKSGSELRAMMKAGAAYVDFVPAEAYTVYARETESGRGPVFSEAMEAAILSRLRMIKKETFTALPDASEGLENRLHRACRTQCSLEEIYDSVKSKRYTHARIRRMTMCAALGVGSADYAADNLYARVLALNERGALVLRMTEAVRNIHVLSKPTTARSMEADAFSLFEKTADAHDLYVLGYQNKKYSAGEMDWKTSPVFLRKE